MILFYDRTTNLITGKIEGRVHTKQHLLMYHDDPETTGRIIINWIPKKYLDANDKEVDPVIERDNVAKIVHEPDVKPEEVDIVLRLDSGELKLDEVIYDPEKELLKLIE